MIAIELSSWILLPLLAASGLSIEDRAIERILLRAEPSLKHVTIVKRFSANEQLNLVVAITAGLYASPLQYWLPTQILNRIVLAAVRN